MSLADLVNVQIASNTLTPTRQGFGTPLIAAVKVPWTTGARVRSYATLAAMVAAGFLVTDPAYRIAQAIFAQNPAPPRVKVGRRASAFTQVVNITPGTPGVGEVFAAKVDGLEVSATGDATPTVAEVCTALAASINALADVDAIIATGGASSGSDQTLLAGSFNGVLGAGALTPTRRLTFTFSSSSDWMATTATVTGLDANGATITEDFAIPNNGGATVTGAKYFAKVTQVAIPAQDGTGGTFTMGVRARVSASVVAASYVACTAPAGELHSYELVTGNLSLTDATTDPGLAADLTAMAAFDGDFYGVLLDSNSSAEILAAAAWVESAKKLMAVQSADVACGDPASTTDVLYLLKAASYARTAPIFYSAIAASWPAAALLGKDLPTDPGSATLAYKTLAGVTALTISDTAHGAVLGKNGNTYEVVGGVAITYPGKVSAGEWADVVRGLDWLTARIREAVYTVLLNNPKVAYTDSGIDLIRAAILAQLSAGQRVQLLASDPKPTVTTPRAAAVDPSERAARHLPGVTFTARLAGAINTLTINGSVSP